MGNEELDKLRARLLTNKNGVIRDPKITIDHDTGARCLRIKIGDALVTLTEDEITDGEKLVRTLLKQVLNAKQPH